MTAKKAATKKPSQKERFKKAAKDGGADLTGAAFASALDKIILPKKAKKKASGGA